MKKYLILIQVRIETEVGKLRKTKLLVKIICISVEYVIDCNGNHLTNKKTFENYINI